MFSYHASSHAEGEADCTGVWYSTAVSVPLFVVRVITPLLLLHCCAKPQEDAAPYWHTLTVCQPLAHTYMYADRVNGVQVRKLHAFVTEKYPRAEPLETVVVSRNVVEQLDAVADEAVAQGSWFEVTMERRLLCCHIGDEVCFLFVRVVGDVRKPPRDARVASVPSVLFFGRECYLACLGSSSVGPPALRSYCSFCRGKLALPNRHCTHKVSCVFKIIDSWYLPLVQHYAVLRMNRVL